MEQKESNLNPRGGNKLKIGLWSNGKKIRSLKEFALESKKRPKENILWAK